jgi:hypothetical protein
VAALRGLNELSVTAVEFTPPDEPEQVHSSYTIDLETADSERQTLASNFAKFAEVLKE